MPQFLGRKTTHCPQDCSVEDFRLLSFLPQPHALQPADHLVAEIRQLVDVVDERDADAGEAGLGEVGELAGDLIGIADDRQAAHALRILVAL